MVFLLLSKIYGNQAIGFHRSEKKSWSTHQELLVGTKILEFRQTPRGKDFSYFGLFSILGAVWLSFNAIRGYFALFALRGCLANYWVMGIVPCFDPI